MSFTHILFKKGDTMRLSIKVEAFGYTWSKEWGDASHIKKLGEGTGVILTVGISFGLYF